ncbi:MAG TPA: cupin domain-containing protein [Flavobacteriaceae bacterium]|nr:cupin domain-containing protein [Flavobacteriaceae bacterium]
MPIKGQVLEEPETGNRFEFLETSESAGAARVCIKMSLFSEGKLVPNHLHTLQDEHFEVLSGKLTVFQNGKETVLLPGEKILLPRNKPHNHYNAHSEPAIFIQTVEPALDFDYLIENRVGLSRDGKIKKGKANMLQELVNLNYFDSKSYLANVPVNLQKTMAKIVGPIGRKLGYRAVYKKYSGIEK